MKKSEIIMCIICLSLIPIGLVVWINNKSMASIKSYTLREYYELNNNDVSFDELLEREEVVIEKAETEPELDEPDNSRVEIVMNFAGDCTIGSDSSFTYSNTFFDVYRQISGDYAYFFSNMQDLFANDDLTVVNLEGTFTDYLVKTPKLYNFRAPPEYANILLSGDIQAVNLANNHTKDYGQTGYEDTLKTLEEYNIPYFGYDNYYIYEKEGIKIGFAGLTSIGESTIYKKIDNAIDYFNENECNSIIFTFHWGIEREYYHNSVQQKVGRYAIDKGANLVVGHHPHVIQGIEEYNGKYIVYSLGNFCFGGNTNPPDKDTMVFNVKYTFESGELIEDVETIYPARVSSVNNRNDYKPTLAQGDEYTRILNKIIKYGNVAADENGIIIKQNNESK